MKKIVIVANASIEIGSGHIIRCLTIAENLRKNCFNVFFMMENLKGNLIEFVKKQNFEVIMQPINANLYIIDRYDLGYQEENYFRRFTKYIMVIDDLANRKHDCDILLDQSLVPNYLDRYDSLVSNSCKKLLGPKYLVLRDEFINIRKQRNIKSLDNILVFMGGTDPTKETLKVLKALESFSYLNVDIVVGVNNIEKNKIKDICESRNYNYHEQINYLSELMKKADLAIGAGGLTNWERIYVGLPSICTIVAENQKDGTTYAGDINICINLGWYENVKIITYKNILNKITLKQLQNISDNGLIITKTDISNIWIKSILELLDD